MVVYLPCSPVQCWRMPPSRLAPCLDLLHDLHGCMVLTVPSSLSITCGTCLCIRCDAVRTSAKPLMYRACVSTSNSALAPRSDGVSAPAMVGGVTLVCAEGSGVCAHRAPLVSGRAIASGPDKLSTTSVLLLSRRAQACRVCNHLLSGLLETTNIGNCTIRVVQSRLSMAGLHHQCHRVTLYITTRLACACIVLYHATDVEQSAPSPSGGDDEKQPKDSVWR